MRVRIIICFLIFFANVLVFSQVHIVKPVKTNSKKTNFGVGIGCTRSIVYLARNVNESNDAFGLNAILTYDNGKLLRLTLEYTTFSDLDIKPTWYGVKAKTIESNMYFIAKTNDKRVFFYPLFGISYNMFNAYFTGENDFLNLNALYEPNAFVNTKWWGLNAGVGIDYNLSFGSMYFNYKMRIGNTEGFNQKNIQDVCFTLGFKLNIKGATIYKVFRGTRSRYSLKTKEAQQ